MSSLLIFATFFYIIGSYTLVLRSVMQVPSAAGQKKAFSTCSSHLTVVFLFYGSVMMTYVSPGSGQAESMQKFTTLFYSVLTPLFNPMIYSLRNKEMKDALKKVLGRLLKLVCDVSELFPMKKFNEALVNGGSNYDSLKVAKCLVI
ncbi:hypothetical protein H8959_016548 [Pygathrix nigripes]